MNSLNHNQRPFKINRPSDKWQNAFLISLAALSTIADASHQADPRALPSPGRSNFIVRFTPFQRELRSRPTTFPKGIWKKTKLWIIQKILFYIPHCLFFSSSHIRAKKTVKYSRTSLYEAMMLLRLCECLSAKAKMRLWIQQKARWMGLPLRDSSLAPKDKELNFEDFSTFSLLIL